MFDASQVEAAVYGHVQVVRMCQVWFVWMDGKRDSYHQCPRRPTLHLNCAPLYTELLGFNVKFRWIQTVEERVITLKGS